MSNPMYEKSMAIIFKGDLAVGWMPTINEADLFCQKNHEYSWDYYISHKEYVRIDELEYMTLYS